MRTSSGTSLLNFATYLFSEVRGSCVSHTSVTTALTIRNIALVLLLLLNQVNAYAVTPGQGDSIINVATLRYDGGSTISSSTIHVIVPASSAIRFLKDARSSSSGSSYSVSPSICLNGTQPNPVLLKSIYRGLGPLSSQRDLAHGNLFATGEPIYIEVYDPDQNIDKSVLDSVDIVIEVSASGDKETLRITETEINSGLFVGYMVSVEEKTAQEDCRLSVVGSHPIKATYTDKSNSSDRSTVTAMVDPLGLVFNSASGAPINGATVTLLNADSGKPAVVYGDDGVSSYPSTLVTGQSVTDSSGTAYQLDAGSYRFPFVLPGRYVLQVTPPNGYAFPSQEKNSVLQTLPGSPYALTLGSRGEVFEVPVGPAIMIDLPLDPKLTNLYVTKQSNKSRAAVGDFIEYQVEVENPTLAAASPVEVIDRLPVGLSYVPGSLILDDGTRPQPQISRDGRQLTIALGSLAPGKKRSMSYVVEVAAGTLQGDNVNSAFATAAGNPSSNTANASVEIVEDLQRDVSHLLGRVMVGNCAPEPPPEGEMMLQLTSSVSQEKIHYRAAITLDGVDAQALRVRIELPPALDYLDGSAELNGETINDPEHLGHTLLFPLGPRPAAWRGQLTFSTQGNERVMGDFSTRAVLLLDRAGLNNISTPTASNRFSEHNYHLHPHFETLKAELSAADQADLKRLVQRLSGVEIRQILVIGHTDDRPISGTKRRLFRDNRALSLARAQAVADALLVGLKLSPEQVLVEGRGESEPTADNNTESGRAANRRVEIEVETLRQRKGDRFELVSGDSGVQKMRLLGDPGEMSEPTLGATLPGLEGVRLYLEDGRFADTDVQGLYHFEALPGGTHVVQLDRSSLPAGYALIECVSNPQFAGTPDSQMVDVQGGSLWRADFYLKRLTATIGRLGVRLQHEQQGEQIDYRASIEVVERPLSNARLMVGLPRGQRYIAGSSRLDGAPLADPQNVFGRLLYPLKPGESRNWSGEIRFSTTLDTRQSGEQVSTAQVYYDLGEEKNQRSMLVENRLFITPAQEQHFSITTHFNTLSAELGEEDRLLLDQVIDQLEGVPITSLQVFGHTDARKIRNNQRFSDNRALSAARASSVADYLLSKLKIRPASVEVHGVGSEQPLVEGSGESVWQQNRRVELIVRQQAKAQLIPLSRDSGVRNELHPIAPPGSGDDGAEIAEADLKPGILSIREGDHLAARIGALRIAVQPQLKYQLSIDDKVISEERIGFRMFDDKSNLNLLSYIGLDFGAPGEHKIKLLGTDTFGVVRHRQEIGYTRTGRIASLELRDNQGNIADGKSPVSLRIALLDEQGKLIPASAELELRGGELRPYLTPEQIQTDPSLQSASDKIKVDSDGLVRFMPVNSSGMYETLLGLGDQEFRLRTYVKPELRREWLMVGIAEGTLAHRKLSGNMQSLAQVGEKEGIYRDGRLAFYAKGRVRGDWLLTLAYDSKRDRKLDQQALYQVIDPNRYYTLYGDTSEQFFDAPSSERLYLRLEANQFNLLFGDFDSGLTVTELARYNRTLTGARVQYEGEELSLSAFASDTNQAFIRDEIRGDGTSGLYRLSRQNLRLNSEKVTIEVRDRFRSEVVISRRTLNRFVDYQLDPRDGTLFFKQPVYSRDDQLNPVWILVEYEVLSSSAQSLVMGGRGALLLMDKKLVLGTTLVSESAKGATARLQGLDLSYAFTDSTKLLAEVASSEQDNPTVQSRGSAWLAEMTHQQSDTEVKLYARRYGTDFGVGQAAGGEIGTQKLGVESTLKLSEALRMTLEASRRENLNTRAVRHLGAAQVDLERDLYQIGAGITLARDEFSTGLKQNSDILSLRARRSLADNKVVLRATNELALGEGASSDYPSRLLLGIDYHASANTTLFAETELAKGADQSSTINRIGLTSSPWSQARVNSSIASETTEYGPRTYASVGLTQGFTLSPNLSLDLGVDHSKTLREPGAIPFNSSVPLSSGSASNDFTAITSGLTYREELWSGNLRAEQRLADELHKRGIFLGLFRQQSPGLGLSSTFEYYDSDSATKRTIDQTLNLSFAWRPITSRWITLNRLTLQKREEQAPVGNSLSRKLVNNLNSNYLFNRHNQISLQHGLKQARDELASSRYRAVTQLVGLEYRHTINPRWDLALKGSSLISQRSRDYSWGVSGGVSPGRNLWITLGYNLRGFIDDDLTAAGYTAQGPYLKLRLSLDRQSSRDFMAWWE